MFLFPLLTICSTSIKFIVNSTNVAELLEYSYSIPVFMVFYSPHCGHCIKMHPEWIKFMNMYEADKSIVAAEVDCVNFRTQAGTIMKVRGYPTYVLLRNGKGETVSVTRTAKAFSEKAEQIKKLYTPKTPLKCKTYYEQTEENVKYPFMTILSSDSLLPPTNLLFNSSSVCDIIQTISQQTKIELNNFMINRTNLHFPNQTYVPANFHISEIRLNPNSILKIGNFSENFYDLSILKEAAIDYLKYSPFGQWNIADSRSDSRYILDESPKRLLLFVYDNHAQDQATNILTRYKSISMKHSSNFFIHHITSQSIKEMWKIDLSNNCSDLNSDLCKSVHLIVTNKNKTQFSLIRNIQDKDIIGVFNNITNETFDSLINTEIHSLAHRSVESSSSLAINEDSTSSASNSIFLFSVILLAGFLAGYGIRTNMNNLNSPDSKNLIEHSENSQNDEQVENDQIEIINESGDEL